MQAAVGLVLRDGEPGPASQAEPGRDGGAPALEVRGLQRVYAGTAALAGADLLVRPGEVHGLLGENGAGKSTLVRIVAGLELPDGGSVSLFGEEVTTALTPDVVAARGCAFIHQDLALIDDLSVAENIALVSGYTRRRGGLINSRATRRRAEQALERLDVSIPVDVPVGTLPVASRGVVAIARALALGARLLVLDEPTATLQKQEVERLLVTLRRLAEKGVASLLITHRVDDVLTACDRITVLRNGRTAATDEVAGLSRDRLVEAIMGGALEEEVTHTEPAPAAAVVLSLERAVAEFVGPVSMGIHAGEIVAVTGFADAGHLPLADAVFGVAPLLAGAMTLGGRPFSPRTPRDAIARGVAAVPADRAGAGAALELTVLENLFMNPSGGGRMRRSAPEGERARTLLKRFDVRPPDPDRQFVTLSGGNQQKALLAKWLQTSPALLVLSEPTAAVDVRARAEIYRHLTESCARDGMAVLLASSDFEEVAELAHRAIVLHRGRVAAELHGDGLTVAAITRAAYGPRG